MSPGDHGELVALWRRHPGNTLTAADGEEGFRLFLEANGDCCFVAREGERMVGSVMAGHDRRRGYVYHLAVDPGLRHGGIGRRLMEACEDALRNAGIEKVHLFIYADNPAVRFYERVGWHRREDITVMSKVLAGDPMTGTRDGGRPPGAGDGGEDRHA